MKIVDLDEALHQTIVESFDKRLHWEPSFNSKYTREYYTDADGKELKINYFSPDAFDNEVAISFSVNDRQDITGAGNANVIFGAVINHINDFVKSNNIQKIKFTAHKPEGGFGVRDTARSDLYRKMVKKLSNSLGFEYNVEDSGNNDIFTLTKKNQKTNEDISHDIIDNADGWGSVPNNKNVDYLGLRVKMKPSVFLSLAAPLKEQPSEKIKNHIKSGGKIASPFLVISTPIEWESGEVDKTAKVLQHEGRNRMKAIMQVHGDIPVEIHLFFAHGLRRRHLSDEMISNLKQNLQAESSEKIIKGPLFALFKNINEDGRIVKGVNTTVDVGVDEIKRQAAKFGNTVDKDGRPPTLSKKVRGSKTNVLFNLGLTEGIYYKNDILLEHVIYEGFLDSAKTYLGNKFNQTYNDIQGSINDLTAAGILIKDVVSEQGYLTKVNAQLDKQIGTLIKQISRLSSENQIISNIWNKIKNIAFTIKNTKNWKGFLGKLGIYGFLKFIITNTNNIKDNVINLLLDKVTDLENIIPNATLGGFLQIFEGLQFVKKYFLDILTSIKSKLEFGKNLIKKESKKYTSLLNELIMDTSGISAGSDWKNEYWGKNIKELPGLPQPVSEYKDYTIYFAGSMDKPKVYVVDSKNTVVGRLELMKISTKAPIYRVNIAVLPKPLRGQNLMQGIYVHLIQEHEMILAADIIQSAGAMRTWAKLNLNPAITVYSAIKDKNGDWKYSRLEGDEYLSGADQIYRKEYQDQISELENEKSSTEKILTQLRKDLRRGVKGARKEDVGFLEQKIKDLETEISKTREEQRRREQMGIDSVYLLASASRKRLPAPKTESTLKMKTRDIFPDLEDEIMEGPMDTLKKFGRGAALATSIGTAGTMGALGYDGVDKASTGTTQSGYSQLAPTTSNTPKPRPQQAEPEKEISGTELAPEKSPRPVPRSSSLTITDNPEERQLLDYAKKNNITGSELAALMSQAAVETQGFSRMVEQGPKSYFNRYEPEHAPERASILGNKYSGDGYKYRGRGYVQLTGRYNYYRAGKALGLDLINEPDLAAEPENALKIALWYWNWRVSNSTDNFDNVKKVTYLINGGYHGLDKRKLYFDKYTRRMQLASEKTESKKYTPLEMAIMEGGHTLEQKSVKESQKTSRLFNALMEGIKIQLERDDDMYILHIRDSNQKHRVEVRGKSGYERGGYDKKDNLHTLIDNLGKAANISDLMNGEPVYINPDHPDGPHAIKYLKKAMNESKTENGIKIHDVSVQDHYRGESFGEKVLSVNDEPKVVITLSILDDEVYIQNIETAKSSQRHGYAKQLVDDLFREFPNKTITVSMMTDSGSKFFRSQYNVDEETGELTQK